MKLNSLVYYHPGRWPEQMRTKWEKEFFRWRKEAELYLTEKANKSHLSLILLQRLLCLLIATWPKRKHVNLMKDDWGVLVLVVRDVRLWVGFHHAAYPLTRENVNRIQLSITSSLNSEWTRVYGQQTPVITFLLTVYVYKKSIIKLPME